MIIFHCLPIFLTGSYLGYVFLLAFALGCIGKLILR